MTRPGRARPAGRSILESPWLAGLLALVVLGLAGVVFLPGLLGAGPSPSASAAGPSAPAASNPTPTPGQSIFARPTPSPIPTFLSYRVQSGDTLSSIARQFATTARSIAWWNRGAYPNLDPESEAYDPDHLEIGWTLVLLPGSVVDDTNPPTPSPGPSTTLPPDETPSPSAGATAVVPTPGPGATTTAPSLATVVSHGSRTSGAIALTFDMGGRLAPASAIVQWLIDHGVHATLFPTGLSGTQTAQGLAAMQLAATRPDLFDFGNHSWDHPDFRDLTTAQMADQLLSTQSALQPVVGTTKPWFRPPFGGYNDTVRAGVRAAGWRYLVMWDVDTIDWKPVADGGPTTEAIVAKVRDNARAGSIVLMHLGGYNTLDALPGILAACSELNLQPQTLTELLGA